MLLSLSHGLAQGTLVGIAHALGVGLSIMAHSLLAAAGGDSRWLAAHPACMRNINRASAGLFIASGVVVLLLYRRRQALLTAAFG